MTIKCNHKLYYQQVFPLFNQSNLLSLTFRFDDGTLLLDASDIKKASALAMPDFCLLDPRVNRWRAPAFQYRLWFADLHLRSQKGEFSFSDQARKYEQLSLIQQVERQPRIYQKEAINRWFEHGKRGQIVLPTGSGKSFVAHRIIQRVARNTLVVVPTLDLLNQWYSGFLETFDIQTVGLLGGGYHDIQPLTITTYDSAFLHMPRYGNRFGLLVFDESHHLPSPTYLRSAVSSIAPFRLGLTATPERQDKRDKLLDEAIGPIVYRKGIKELAGDFLSSYDIVRITANLNKEEEEMYKDARKIYLDFVRKNRIQFGHGGWGDFIMLSSRSREGRQAMRAYRTQRRIALSSSEKKRLVEQLIIKHHQDRIIIFTNDNETVYDISRQLLAPAITHQTPTKERRTILKRFNTGTYPVIVTARVLNEGVDVPEANVAIVLSGTSSVREHVQRLGRILRPRENKHATLYEIISAKTAEEAVSLRRREHDAYR